MSNLYNDIIFENLFENLHTLIRFYYKLQRAQYLDEGLTEDKAAEAARKEFENLSK